MGSAAPQQSIPCALFCTFMRLSTTAPVSHAQEFVLSVVYAVLFLAVFIIVCVGASNRYGSSNSSSAYGTAAVSWQRARTVANASLPIRFAVFHRADNGGVWSKRLGLLHYVAPRHRQQHNTATWRNGRRQALSQRRSSSDCCRIPLHSYYAVLK